MAVQIGIGGWWVGVDVGFVEGCVGWSRGVEERIVAVGSGGDVGGSEGYRVVKDCGGRLGCVWVIGIEERRRRMRDESGCIFGFGYGVGLI